MIRRQLLTGLVMTAALIILTGVLYPVAIWGIGQFAFKDNADGSFVQDQHGTEVGSALLGQRFVDVDGHPDPRYFQPRPSAAGHGYDPTKTGGTNLGPSNSKLLDAVAQAVSDYRKLNGLPADTQVPVDAVTSSGSGVDPHISVANARLQAPRVAQQRHLSVDKVLELVARHTTDRPWGFLGEKVVNVLLLNLDLDHQT